MRKSWVRKGLVCGIILFFASNIIIPNLSGNLEIKNKFTSNKYELTIENKSGFLSESPPIKYNSQVSKETRDIQKSFLESPFQKQWDKIFGISGVSTELYGVQQTTDGGYIITGSSWSSIDSSTYVDLWLLKTDPEGNEQWQKFFGGSQWEKGNSVDQTNDGGYIIGGLTVSYATTGWYDAWLIKTDSNGNMQWNITFGPSDGDEYFYSVQQVNDGGYIAAGNIIYATKKADGMLCKFDSKGNKQWLKILGGDKEDAIWQVEQTNDRGYILAGETESYGAGKSDGWLIKLDNEGNKQWDKTFGGTNRDLFGSVQQTKDGGYIVTGGIDAVVNDGDLLLIKTDNNGNEIWRKVFGGNVKQEYGADVKQTNDLGYIIAGLTSTFGAGNADFWLIKTDGNGDIQGSITYGGSDLDLAYSVSQTNDNGFIIGGLTASFGPGYCNGLLIKVSPYDAGVTEYNGLLIGLNDGIASFGGNDVNIIFNTLLKTKNWYNLEKLVNDDANGSNFEHAMGRLAIKADINDISLFYFSGHGNKGDQIGSYYFKLKDYDVFNDFGFYQINDYLSLIPGHVIVIFNSCNSGGFIQSIKGNNRIIISSCNADELSHNIFIPPQGLFSYTLIKGLEGNADSNNDKKITAVELYNYHDQNWYWIIITTLCKLLWSQTPMYQGGDLIIAEL